ncbi:MAG TPA: carboxylesterase [Aeromonadales bacterium]|nr:carboxylesterase [Aeromonadales bacterium]
MTHQAPVILDIGNSEIPVEQQYSVIWLHGLGADGHDFEPIVPTLQLQGKTVRFIFPNAKVQPVTINGGMAMPSWYDIMGLDIDSRADAEGILESVTYINSLINKEIARGIASKNIVMAGFSQGGVVALHCGLSFPQPLAGIMALSTYLPDVEDLTSRLSEENRTISIFQAHGTQDPVVPITLGEMAHHQLQQWNYPAQWHTYSMPHAVIPQEINDISRWLNEVLD